MTIVEPVERFDQLMIIAIAADELTPFALASLLIEAAGRRMTKIRTHAPSLNAVCALRRQRAHKISVIKLLSHQGHRLASDRQLLVSGNHQHGHGGIRSRNDARLLRAGLVQVLIELNAE